MSDPQIRSAKAKLARADEHLADLNVAVASFQDDNPVSIHTNPQSDGEVLEVTYTLHVEPVPNYVSLIFGDALVNLQSALDHAAKALIPASDRRSGVGQSGFPLGPWHPDGHKGRGYLRKNTTSMKPVEEARRFFKAIAANHGQKNWRSEPLKWLHTLANTDKHEFILSARATIQANKVQSTIFYRGHVTQFNFWFDNAKDGTIQNFSIDLAGTTTGRPMWILEGVRDGLRLVDLWTTNEMPGWHNHFSSTVGIVSDPYPDSDVRETLSQIRERVAEVIGWIEEFIEDRTCFDWDPT